MEEAHTKQMLFPADSGICFIGDSLTRQNNYVSRIFARLLKEYPQKHILVRSCGISGGTVDTGLAFLSKDVYDRKTTHAVLLFGVNDAQLWNLADPSEESRAALERAFGHYCERLPLLCDSLTSRGIRIILCTPPPYAEFQSGGNPPYAGGYALLQRYADAVRTLAREKGYLLVDYHTALSGQYLHEVLYQEDRIHPNDLGQSRMADCFCETLGIYPRDSFHTGEYIPLETLLKNAGMEEWYSTVIRLRNIYSFEYAFLRDDTGTAEEKVRFAEEFVREKKWGTVAFYEKISKDYLIDKPREEAIESRIEALTEALYDRHE